jgi:hypothetical protein
MPSRPVCEGQQVTLLVLTDDELALLRFTGDLYFSHESPLRAIERESREPSDYAGSYQALVDRRVLDPQAFRMTDDALNRVAPVSEADARLMHLSVDEHGGVVQEDYWLLDEIAVHYEHQPTTGRHVFGPDLDPHQLVQHLGRGLVPRRSGGDRFDATLSATEVLATVLVLDAASRCDRRRLNRDEARAALKRLPPDQGLGAAIPGGLPASTTTFSDPRFQAGRKQGGTTTPRSPDLLLKDLVGRGVLLDDGGSLRVHQTLHDVASIGQRRHTFVRTDFREEDWLVRETTVLPVDGSLLVIAPVRGGFRIAELDGDGLFDVLRQATGPHHAPTTTPSPGQRLAALLAGQPRKV